MHYSNPTVVTFITTMQIVSAAKSLIPSFQAYSDDDKRYHLGLTWTDDKGLRDEHKLELRYTRNSEQLALKGEIEFEIVESAIKKMGIDPDKSFPEFK